MATRHLAKLGAMLRSLRKAGFEERRFDTGEVELNYAVGRRNVLATPHLGYVTLEAYFGAAIDALLLKTGPPVHR